MEQRILGGRYQLIAKLGEGGMGAVWRAQHLTLGTPLAVKLIDPSIAQSAEAMARFKREAQATAELRSAHVVQIIDYGTDGGIPFIAMELLEGETLAARLERVYSLPPSSTAIILSQVARALTRAHAAGIVHRDLKPANIFLVPEVDDDITKVLDFGIAKHLCALTDSVGVKTKVGEILGSPYYMSPEQALGETTIDHRTDIWSLGVIAFQCLTGQRPFDRETPGAALMAICCDPIPTPSELAAVPTGFDAWFARAAARNPAERFESAAAAAAALRAICGTTSSGRPSLPMLRRDTMVTGRGGSVITAATALTPTELGDADGTSRKMRVRGGVLAVVGACSFCTIGFVLAGSQGHSQPFVMSSASSASKPIRVTLAATPAAVPAEALVPNALAVHQSGGGPTVELALPGLDTIASKQLPAPRKKLQLASSWTRTTEGKTKKSNTKSSTVVVPLHAEPLASGSDRTRDTDIDKEVGF